jgi:hypothetical protein
LKAFGGFVLGGFGGIFVGVLIGAILMFFLFPTATGLIANPAHQRIINAMQIKTTFNGQTVALKPMCVDAGNYGYGAGYYPEAVFTFSKAYPQSTWLWKIGSGDTEVVSSIWGPDDSGNMCTIEFGRQCGADIHIYWNGVEKWTMTSAQGFLGVDVPLS